MSDGLRLPGTLGLPKNPRGLVIFAHGSGSSRLSPRNRAVAAEIQARGCGTLLFDLLTDEEARDRARVFDIDLLAQRVAGAVAWARRNAETIGIPIGLFGASTGAAAALVAAADPRLAIAAVVSRGGRADLAGNHLSRVRCPTLLVVGGADREVLELNRQAFVRLNCRKGLEVVPGATHLFEEPGALEQVVDLAASWFSAAFARALSDSDRPANARCQ
ncbi:dienelactone hydrolase family protein [Jannaschia seohaensis]|uniref:dienelactone hydrolase family protein n=1 Tax=Jannaschia seohaensis TaxID=475081 RepID=UPI001B8868EC|nr:alpha/beta family hydrolase [Jannaschia seohaensis]